MTELKSCPFCNSNDLFIDENWENYDNPYFVHCGKCHAKGPTVSRKEKAVELWNGRVKE